MLILKNVSRHFLQGDKEISVLKDVCLHLKPGKIVGLLGASGTGKSTLLHLAGLLDHPSSGEILFKSKNVTHAKDKERTRIRRNFIGFVYQFHYLLPEFTALENVIIPQTIAGVSHQKAKDFACELLEKLGLSHRLHHYPCKLSGGEQQRVALARALSNKPTLLLADEPTGNLDPQTTKIVFNEMLTIIRESQVAALVATHDFNLAKMMDETVSLHEGQIQNVEMV